MPAPKSESSPSGSMRQLEATQLEATHTYGHASQDGIVTTSRGDGIVTVYFRGDGIVTVYFRGVACVFRGGLLLRSGLRFQGQAIQSSRLDAGVGQIR